MANLDGTPSDPGWDPGEGLDGTPRDSNRLLGLSENRLILANRFRIPEFNPFFANRTSGG